jgi:hypothetical protein
MASLKASFARIKAIAFGSLSSITKTCFTELFIKVLEISLTDVGYARPYSQILEERLECLVGGQTL